jgi:hypothetical protein
LELRILFPALIKWRTLAACEPPTVDPPDSHGNVIEAVAALNA